MSAYQSTQGFFSLNKEKRNNLLENQNFILQYFRLCTILVSLPCYLTCKMHAESGLLKKKKKVYYNFHDGVITTNLHNIHMHVHTVTRHL